MNREDQEAILRAYCRKIMSAFGNPSMWYRSPIHSHFEKPVLPSVWFERLKDTGDGYPDEVEYPTCEAAIDDAVKAHPGLKPWPRDAVMIVAARAGEADLKMMADIHPAECRDCNAKLHADTRSIKTATVFGNSVKFFCRDCVLFYIPTPTRIDGRGNPA